MGASCGGLEDLRGYHHQPQARKFIALGHSMGAAVLTIYAQTCDDFSSMVLSSPMHQVNTDPYSEFVACIIANFFGTVLCRSEEYTIVQGEYKPDKDTFEDNKSTHDPVRWARKKEVFQQFPIGGPTNRWFQATVPANRDMRKDADKLKLPILMFQADLDETVVNSAQDQVCDDAKDCTKINFPGAFHNIFWELDEIRGVVLDSHIKPFLRVTPFPPAHWQS